MRPTNASINEWQWTRTAFRGQIHPLFTYSSTKISFLPKSFEVLNTGWKLVRAKWSDTVRSAEIFVYTWVWEAPSNTQLRPFVIKDQDQNTGFRMPNKWHICKEGQEGNKNRQRRGLLVFSEVPSLSSAGSRPGCFHTSLGCELRSLIRVSLGVLCHAGKALIRLDSLEASKKAT
jgi:hypothetical protein